MFTFQTPAMKLEIWKVITSMGFEVTIRTETALLMIQSKMSQLIESKTPGIIYSVDLSAAFDLLRPDKFFELMKDTISPPLLSALVDFLNWQNI